MAETGHGATHLLDPPLAALVDLPGVEAGVVATQDGLPLAVRVPATYDSEALAAAAGALGELSAELAVRLRQGAFQFVALDADRYRLIVRPVPLGFLVVVTDLGVSADLIAAEMSRAAQALNRAAEPLM